MKKNFKRNKILLTSLIGLAVVASASVAFSTWIFGLNKDNASIEGITVTVDGYKDTTKYIDIVAAPNETIKLAEYSAIDPSNNIAYTEDIIDETGKGDFDINLSKFEFAYSSDQYKFENITFEMVVYKGTDATKTDINKVSADNVHSEANATNKTIKMRDAKEYEYISLATATISETDLTTWFDDAQQIGSYTYYEAKTANKKLSLKWSDYFGTAADASPATFYNAKYTDYIKDGTKTIKDKLQFLNTANSEMEAMRGIFKNTETLQIKITAKLNVKDKTAGA
ncbi:MAG: hypothetical protein MR606_00400 [Mollicutes bacterium]|nr:hypothetical protein [Mollicutes bacterium]MDD7263745.1 hypothetical protein [bacterium]MDY4979799.1 hypothetical protein [Candidatus Onthovivens sp.]